MAGRGGPSFLKRQKEQKRAAKANAKRAAQQARRAAKANGEDINPDFNPDDVDAAPIDEESPPPDADPAS